MGLYSIQHGCHSGVIRSHLHSVGIGKCLLGSAQETERIVR